MSKVTFEDTAFEHYSDWARENIKLFDRIRDLIKDIQPSPFKGIGKPEPLKHLRGCWSRRIDRNIGWFTGLLPTVRYS